MLNRHYAPRALWLATVLALTGALGLTGCAPEEAPPADDGDYPLSDLGSLYSDAPDDRGMSLAFDDKADGTIPARFDLIAIQTPVRNQGRRGTCSIFATTALMESMYVAEGTLTNPDFSEQFLQWSAKSEVRSFQNTEGSSASSNLQAINRFGIVEETAWPYESSAWGTSNDPMCTGDSRPVHCYTNGEPPAAALAAQRFTLPAGRWINPTPRSLQGHMVSTRTAIVVGGSFFYQAWSHGRSTLTTNSDNASNGYVLSPNAEDIADSSGDRSAGHAYLLVGFDSELSVVRRDGMGNEILDAEGNPEMETGFFLFKNSWGAGGSWGSRNPHGAGYGWISYAYVQEHLTAYVTGLPTVMRPEVCNDGEDNDRNGDVDCDDAACSGERACMDPVDDYTNGTAMPIPDNSPAGVTSEITIAEGGTISSLAVSVDITHTYRGDLSVRLVRDDGEAVLFDRTGGSADDLVQTFTVSEFNGADAAGTYRLVVADHAGQDTGTLNSFSLDITRCTTDCSGTPTPRAPVEDTATTPIPDNSTVQRTLTVAEGGEITSMSVSVDITHSFPYELTVRFGREGGREFVLVHEDSSSETGIVRTFDVPGVVGMDAAGSWVLTVQDNATADTGSINGWSIDITTR